MAGEDVKVIGLWASPFAMRPRIALNIKGVDYEYLEDNMQAKSELLLKSNPVYKKMPVLLHDERPICESMVIVEYIDHVWKNSSTAPPLLPADPYDLALAKFWAFFVDDKWLPSMMNIIKVETHEEKVRAIERIHANTQLLEGAFEKSSNGKSFFGGDCIGYLDIAFGSFLGWSETTGKMAGIEIISEAKTPRLSQWAKSFCNDETVKGVMPETNRLLEYTKVWLSKWKSSS